MFLTQLAGPATSFHEDEPGALSKAELPTSFLWTIAPLDINDGVSS